MFLFIGGLECTLAGYSPSEVQWTDLGLVYAVLFNTHFGISFSFCSLKDVSNPSSTFSIIEMKNSVSKVGGASNRQTHQFGAEISSLEAARNAGNI